MTETLKFRPYCCCTAGTSPTQSSIAFPNYCNSECFHCIDSSIPSSIPSDFFAVEVARPILGSAESLYRCLSPIDDSMRKCSNVIKLAYSSQRKMSWIASAKPILRHPQSYTFPRTPGVPPQRYEPHVRQVGTPGPLLPRHDVLPISILLIGSADPKRATNR